MLTCRALLAHAEPDVGGTSLYVYVTCERGGRSAKAPRMVVDAVNKSSKYESHLIRRLAGDVTWAKYENGEIKFKCNKRCAFVLKVWAKTGLPVFPFVTDVEIIKNSKNIMSFKANATDVRERGGVLVLKSVGLSKVIDIRNVERLINVPILMAEPPISPRRSFFAYFPGGELHFITSGKKELVTKKLDIKLMSSYFYGLLLSFADRKKVEIVGRKKEGWVKLEEIDEVPNKIEWCYAWNSPAVALHYSNKVVLKSLSGEMLNVTLPGTISSSLSPDAKRLIRSTKEKVQIIDLEGGDVLKEFSVPNVRVIEWSFFSDFAVLCTDYACWIYSELSNQLVLVRLVRGVTGAWWSPSTYNLYLARKGKLDIMSFDPRGVRALLPVARRPIPRETS